MFLLGQGETTALSIGVLEICGIATFVIGSYLQHRAHVGLANLRKGKGLANIFHFMSINSIVNEYCFT